MKQITRILGALAVIVITFLIIDQAFGLMADKMIATQSTGKPAYDISRKGTEKLVVVGSSRASHHYDTKYFTDSLDLPSYNLGMDGRGLTYYEAVLMSYLDNNRPEIIVLDLLPSDFDGNLNERVSALYPYMKGNRHIERISREVSPSNSLTLKSNLYAYNAALLPELKWKLQKYNPDNLGFIPLEPKKMNGMVESELDISANIDSVSLMSFNNIVKTARERNIKLVVVVSPIFNKLKGMDNFNRIVNQYDNVYFINDASFQFKEPSAMYNDNAHLNKDGARVFSKKFISQLDSINSL